MNELGSDQATLSDHLRSVRRRAWWVFVGALVGLGSAAIVLRDDARSDAIAEVAVNYRWNAVDIGSPSADARDAAARRDELVPDLRHRMISVEGQDDGFRLVFTAEASTIRNAERYATEFADAYRRDRQAEINRRLDEQINLEKQSLSEIQRRLDAEVQLTDSAVDDAALILEVISRTRHLAELLQSRGPISIMSEPETVLTKSVPIDAGSYVPFVLLVALGALVGATLAAIVGRLDRRLYARSDLERVVHGVPVLAVTNEPGDVASLLPAAGSVAERFGSEVVLGVIGVGAGVGSLVADATEGLQGALNLVEPSTSGQIPELLPIPYSLTDDPSQLVSARGTHGVVIVVRAGTTKDGELVDAVSSLGLVGAKVVGLLLVDVPVNELVAARLPLSS